MKHLNFQNQFDEWLEKQCPDCSIVDFYQELIGKFCGCGLPEENLLYIKRGLEALALEKWEEREPAGIKNCGDKWSWRFFLYWADSAGLTEHGGGVFASWFNLYGECILEDLQELERRGELG